MNRLLPNFKLMMSILVGMTTVITASAEIKQVLQYPTTQTVYVTEKGTVLASNLQEDFSGGIYRSDDQGETWTECEATDYNYSKFIEYDGDIYALGSGCILAKSGDEGKTWTYVDYSATAEPYAPKGYIEGCVCYGAAVKGNRLYVADLLCGIMYTEDKGETWVMTNRESITYRDQFGEFIESVYGLASFNDKIYALGLYSVFSYDEENDKWDYVRGSNCLSVYTQYGDKLVCGRAIANDDYNADFLLYTENGSDWNAVKRPADMIDNYVRALTSDESTLYVGMLNKGIHCTSDFGETWYDISEGLPVTKYGYYFTINLAQDKDYLYAAIYNDDATDMLSGIYRIAKSELPTAGAGITDTAYDKSHEISVSGGKLTITGDVISAAIYDIAGKHIMTVNSNTADVSALAKGIYVCVITSGSGVESMVFGI